MALTPDTTALPCGDPAAMGALLLDLEPRMTAVALRFTRDHEAAAEVVQNAYEKVLRHCHQFRGNARVSTWIHRIVANEALMWLRAEHRRLARTVALESWDDWIEDPSPSAVDRLCARQRATQMRRGLGKLDPRERDVLLECGLGGQSYDEYGRQKGVHRDAVKSRAFRARRRLNRILRRI